MYAKPTSRVGIVGIGGLGHMGVKFAAAYGCDVTAFTSSESKFDEARGFGASHVVSSRDSAAIKKLAGTFDLLIVTVNVTLDWAAMIASLAPNGRMHVVGGGAGADSGRGVLVDLLARRAFPAHRPVRRWRSTRCSILPRGITSRRRRSTFR